MSMRRVVVAIFVAAWAGGWGCAALIGIQDTKDDQADSPDASRDGSEDANGTDAGVDGGPSDAAIDGDAGPTCPGIHGPKMVRVTAGFCIDATEVTRGDYAAFIAASPATGGQGVE